MTLEGLSTLADLEKVASPGPWYVEHLDDDLCQGAVAVTTREDHRSGSMWFGSWPSESVVAACLVQSPPYVMPADDRFEENAQLIAAMRNALPELLRLAKLGLQQSS